MGVVLDSGYIHGQYMSNKYNLFHKTWTAGLRRWRSKRRRRKKYIYVYRQRRQGL